MTLSHFTIGNPRIKINAMRFADNNVRNEQIYNIFIRTKSNGCFSEQVGE